jgi:RAC serine/threonine-protein kinase
LTRLFYSFQTDDLLCFVLEYVNGGELFFHLSKDKRFSEDRTRFYIAEIGLAMTYLHNEGIIYRDLKLENLMLDHEGHIKITDFGLCKEDVNFGDSTGTFCGTPEYLAPEVIEDSDYGRAVDWWGVGVVMYEMISGVLPFRSRDHEELFGLILAKEVKVPAFFSAEAKDCVTRLLIKKPSDRLGGGETGGAEVLSHPFFKAIDLKKLEAKELKPPFTPKIASATDTSNFDTFFTSEKARITPEAGGAASAAEKDQAFKNFKEVSKK